MTHDELLAKKYQNCGTYAGWTKHYRAKETPCSACLVAKQEYQANWKATHPEKVKVFSKAYRVRHYKKVRKYIDQYKKNNVEQYRTYYRNSSRKRRAVYSEPYTEVLILTTYGTVCHICNKDINFSSPRLVGVKGWEQGLHIDHLIPLSKGGPDTLANVRPSHGLCNITKNGNMPNELG